MTINHSRGSYPVQFGSIADAWARFDQPPFIVTDENVHRAWGGRLPDGPTFVVPPGERSKSLQCYGQALEWLARHGASRRSVIAAFGGGVVGDLAGFLAASYMRGVQFVQIPTTLLSQVDSSVGGKVGIDLEAGKNLVGAFWPPSRVEICLETLSTLPEREFWAGAAEILKTRLILDAAMDLSHLHPGSEDLPRIVAWAIAQKAKVVAEDEFETTGLRAILNFGHTLGHALEKALHYETLLHGEAVAIGMVFESKLGERIGVTPAGTSELVAEACHRLHLPTTIPEGLNPSDLVDTMKRDKKARDGRLSFSLLTQVGACKLCDDVDESLVVELLNP